jgi:hypothetical protein
VTESSPTAVIPAAGWTALAILIFGAGLAISFSGYWGNDLTEVVPVPASEFVERGDAGRHVRQLTLNDYRMGVWAFSRNAYTLVNHPTRLFQAEPCYPVDDALALHHPVITQGLVALPGYLLTGDPVATTNLLLFATILLGALAVTLLVADWTGMAAAGIVAGLLYAFHPAQIGSPFHLGTKDYTWLVLALFFARRLFERGRWRDALGLAACAALQMATSFYPFLASAIIAVPMLAWLLWHYGVKQLPVSRIVVVVLLSLAAALFVFSPYFGLPESDLPKRINPFFAPWSRFAPGGALFPGWPCLLLAVAGLSLGRRRAFSGLTGDPRAALVVAALLVALLATGGNVVANLAVLKGEEPPAMTLPNLFTALRAVVPGLDAVRLPSMLASGTRMLLCILAGFGAAALLRTAPRKALPYAAALLLLVVSLDTLRPGFLGMHPRVVFEALPIRPSDETIEFFRELQVAGNRGPLLELPIDRSTKAYAFNQAPLQHLLTAYHHRRTSGCSPAFTPAEVRALAPLSLRFGEPGSIDTVRDLGFTTILVHHPPSRRGSGRYAARVARAARSSAGQLVQIAGNESMTAYELRD